MAARNLPPIQPAINVVLYPPGEKPPETNRAPGEPTALDDLANRDIDVAAPVGKSQPELADELNQSRYVIREDPFATAEEEYPKFTMQELLTIMTCAAIGMGGTRWMPSAWFAVVVQVIGLLVLGTLIMLGKDSRRTTLVWWGSLSMYLAAVVTGIVLGQLD